MLELHEDVIPVLYGDMVIDTDLKASVVSGDAIISYLARSLKVNKVFFGANVDGIYDANPIKDKNAKLIPEINSENINDILNKVSGSNNIDVTGGMQGKLLEIMDIFNNVEILVFDITKQENIYKVLIGNQFDCTTIRL